MPESNKERFAARLRELRVSAGLSRQELADRAGLKLGAVRDLEQGVNGPTWDTVLALAKVLGVDCTAFTEEPAAEPSEKVEQTRKAGRPPKKPTATEEPAEEPAEEATAEKPAGKKRKGK